MRIVLVEDDKFLREFYTQKLKEKNCEVAVASDGEEGLAKIVQNKPDIILLDLIMPNKDGFDVLEALAKDVTVSSIPVLVFSTLGQEDDVQKAIQMGAKGYVNKSFYDFDNLYNKILQLTQK
jgi:DNA-binding response OmpR family regulator